MKGGKKSAEEQNPERGGEKQRDTQIMERKVQERNNIPKEGKNRGKCFLGGYHWVKGGPEREKKKRLIMAI